MVIGHNDDIRADLHIVYGDSCVLNGATAKWMNCFKDGRVTTKDDKLTGRPMTVTNEKKVVEIQEYILKDRRETVEMLRDTLGFRMLQLRTLCLISLEFAVFRGITRLLLPDQMGQGVKRCREYCQ